MTDNTLDGGTLLISISNNDNKDEKSQELNPRTQKHKTKHNIRTLVMNRPFIHFTKLIYMRLQLEMDWLNARFFWSICDMKEFTFKNELNMHVAKVSDQVGEVHRFSAFWSPKPLLSALLLSYLK